jgi:hypothetical protein
MLVGVPWQRGLASICLRRSVIASWQEARRQGSCGELCRGDWRVSGRQTFVSGLDTGVGNAGDARTGAQESLRVVSGVFLVVQELAFGVDERPGLHELGQ